MCKFVLVQFRIFDKGGAKQSHTQNMHLPFDFYERDAYSNAHCNPNSCDFHISSIMIIRRERSSYHHGYKLLSSGGTPLANIDGLHLP